MGKLVAVPKVTTDATIQLSEAELEALSRLTSYSLDSFLKFFDENMGSLGLTQKEGFKQLWESRGQISEILSRLRKAKEAFAS